MMKKLLTYVKQTHSLKPQAVQVGNNTSSSTALSTGVPQDSGLSHLLFTWTQLHTNLQHHSYGEVCRWHNSGGSHYQEWWNPQQKEVGFLTTWCRDNNLVQNFSKAKEIVVYFWRGRAQHPPLGINSAAMERVSSTTFLVVHISEDPSWPTNTGSLVKKA